MACSFPNLHYRGPALAAPIFQQNYGPKTWSAKPELFFLVEHPPRPHFNGANNSRAMQAEEFCSPKNQRIRSCSKEKKLHMTIYKFTKKPRIAVTTQR